MTTRTSLQHAILKILSTHKSISLGDLTRDVLDYLQTIEDTSSRKVKPDYLIKRTLKKLEEKGVLTTSGNFSDTDIISLSNEGNDHLRKMTLSRGQQILPTKWDGTWRLVILDFGTEDQRVRNAVRYILKKAHFYCLKNSVWVSPFNCEPIIRELQYHLGIGPEVLFVEAQKMDKAAEDELLEYFQLER